MIESLKFSMSASEIVMRRLPILWWAMVSGSPSAQAEARKMVVEKQMAFAEACFAVNMQLMAAAWKPWTQWQAGDQATLFGDMMAAAHRPMAKRVDGNVKRLRR